LIIAFQLFFQFKYSQQTFHLGFSFYVFSTDVSPWHKHVSTKKRNTQNKGWVRWLL